MGDAPKVGTFHAAGESAAYRYLGWGLKRMARRLDHRCAVSPDAVALAESGLGGTYELLFNGVEVERFSEGPAHPTDGPTMFFLGRHEPRKGLDVLLAALADLPSDVRVWVGGDGPQTEELKERYRRRRSHRVARPHQRRRALGPDAWLHGVLLAVGARRVLRDGPPRGDGVGLRAGGLRPRRASQRGQRRRRRPPHARRRRGGAGQGPAPGPRRPRRCEPSWWPGGVGGPSSSRWPHLAERYDEIYRQLVPRL